MFASKIKKLRKAAGLTQTDAAFHCGVKFARWQKWEYSKATPDPMIQKLVLDKLKALTK